MKITPTPVTAALAGLFSALVMPALWLRLGSGSADSTWVIVALLLTVALPAHAFVVGFGRSPAPQAGTLDTALLKRVAAWLASALATVAVTALVRA